MAREAIRELGLGVSTGKLTDDTLLRWFLPIS